MLILLGHDLCAGSDEDSVRMTRFLEQGLDRPLALGIAVGSDLDKNPGGINVGRQVHSSFLF
jgi:hypothetical protein